METPAGERALEDAVRWGRALLKFISPNDVGLTGGHQCGFYIPKSTRRLFTPHGPQKGQNQDHDTNVTWPDGRITNSVVKWYGTGSRSEYRLTRFGKDFPWLSGDCVGDLLVLIPTSPSTCLAHVLDAEGDIEGMQESLGAEIIKSFAFYDGNAAPTVPGGKQCVERYFRQIVEENNSFPPTQKLAEHTRKVLEQCIAGFHRMLADNRLIQLIEAEYSLFKMLERQICQGEIVRPFGSVDDFIATASSIMNRRKSRAGKSLENHFDGILRDAKIPFDNNARIDGNARPDILIPGKASYDDPHFPAEKLCLLGLKTTCKDRWRQVLNEGRRVPVKHLLTLQKGISVNQLNEMQDAKITLVVPGPLHRAYPTSSRMKIITVEQFIVNVRNNLT